MKFSDSPEPMPPGILAPGFENKIMHASFRIGDNVLMASDGCNADEKLSGFSISISFDTEAEVDRSLYRPERGRTRTMPWARPSGPPRFGMLTDRFGVSWMVSVAVQH